MLGRRGYRKWFQATGLPGWVRAQQEIPPYSQGFWGRGPNCGWNSWLPRGRWSGTYGPRNQVPEGPQFTEPTKQQELELLGSQKKAMEDQVEYLKRSLKELNEDMNQLKKEVR
ncbi:DUF5320 family protein [archaeon]|nr:DUF5320 family protein [archaeon]